MPPGRAPVSYLNLDLRVRSVLVFGSEGRGLRRLVAETCDELAALPMSGPVESLNVSVAAAVFLYEARRQRRPRLPAGPPRCPTQDGSPPAAESGMKTA